MRRYYTVFGILLIPHIINFAVAAPVLVLKKPQAGVDVVQDAVTTLGKRGGELDARFPALFGVMEADRHAARPSSSSPSAPADGWTNLRQPLSPIPEETSPVSSPDHASPSP